MARFLRTLWMAVWFTRGLYYKTFIKYGFCCKIVPLSKPVKVTDNNEKHMLTMYHILYKYVMFYDTGPGQLNLADIVQVS
jgi:hypothetical protein